MTDSHDENPYASPVGDASYYPDTMGQSDSGLSRDGKVLVATKNAVFPDRCVKCNAPANGYRLKRKLFWHHPAYYLFIIFCNILVYVVVALIVRKTAEYRVGVCPMHRSKRRNAILIGWGGFLLGVLMLLVGAMEESAILAIAGLVFLVVGIICGIAGSRIISPKRIDANYAWLRGAGLEFLDSIETKSTTA
jgi:hypothetical protein